MSTVAQGKKTETRVTDYLQSKGYSIVRRNYRFKRYETDIIARKDRVLVFVEVKYRREIEGFDPYNAISRKQMRNIVRCAENFLAHEAVYEDYYARFDAVFVIGKGEKNTIKHIKNAFAVSDCS